MALIEFGIWASRRALGEEGPDAARLHEELCCGALRLGGSDRMIDAALIA